MKAFIFLMIVLVQAFSCYSKEAIWIDYDVAVGKIIRDVDDGFALFHALESKKLNLVGVSTIFGNIKNPEKMVKITKRLLELHDRLDIPVYRGAYSAQDLGVMTPAVLGLIEALEKQPLTVLAMGRLTNVASVVSLRPDLVSNIKELLVMGGRQKEYNSAVGKSEVVFWDANIDGDFESVRKVIESNVKLRMIPTESMKKSIITRKHLKKLNKSFKRHRWLARKSVVWKKIWQIYPRMKGFIPWDLFLVSYITHPEDFSCFEGIPTDLVKLKNDTTFNRSGENGAYKYFLTASFSLVSNFRASYCYDIRPTHVDEIINSWL